MKETKDKVTNGNYLQGYFTQFPNIIDDAGLDPYEFRVLLHYYRVGNCWEGTRKTAERCGISRTKVAEARISLEAKSFITIEENTNGVTITVIDKSRENVDKYAPLGGLPGGRKRSATRTPSGLQGGHKNNPKKNTKEELPEPEGSVTKEAVSEVETPPSETIAAEPQTVLALGDPPDPQKAAFPLCVDVWYNLDKSRKFTGVDGKKLKSIISRIVHYMKAEGKADMLTPENITVFFQWMVTHPGLSSFMRGAQLSVFDSQFDKTVFELRYGKKQDNYHSQNSASRMFGKYKDL